VCNDIYFQVAFVCLAGSSMAGLDSQRVKELVRISLH
jgi:hypothetical protein